MALIEFIFETEWHFIGSIILIVVTGEALEGIVGAFFRGRKKHD